MHQRTPEATTPATSDGKVHVFVADVIPPAPAHPHAAPTSNAALIIARVLGVRDRSGVLTPAQCGKSTAAALFESMCS